MKRNMLTCILYTLIQWTWGIVQNIGGAVLFLFYLIKEPGSKVSYYHGAIVIKRKPGLGSMGLGMFIFFGHEGDPDTEGIMVHEWGHTVQSVILGPLFIPVIGIPSLIWAFTPSLRKMRKEKGIKYTDLYCEHWASAMGEKLTGTKAVWF